MGQGFSVGKIGIFMQDGSAAVPGHSFISDTDTGLWRPSSNVLALSAGGIETIRYPVPMVIATAVGQVIVPSTTTALAFTTETHDPYFLHDIAIDNSRFYALSSGLYLMILTVTWGISATGLRQQSIRFNNVTTGTSTFSNLGGATFPTYQVCAMGYLASGQFADCVVWHSDSVNLSTNNSSVQFAKLG